MTSHLEHYLAFYEGREAPGYAVLVTGAWGSGKTYQVKRAIDEPRRCYVSLFGLQSSNDISAAVFAAMFPKKAGIKKVADALSGMSAGIPNVASVGLGQVPSAITNALLGQEIETNRILVFDDLERCKLPLNETLGVINRYVEHHGCRVIVIANEGKMGEFKEVKEKIFGQTIHISPNIQEALSEFVKTFPSERDYLEKYKPLLQDLFVESGEQSLRILRHLVEDIVRLRGCLAPHHRCHDNAMRELLRLFGALDIEIRSGRLVEIDLRDRFKSQAAGLMQASKSNTPEPAFISASKRYQSIDITNQILTDEALVSTLVHGRYDQSTISEGIDQSPHFLRKGTVSPWRIVWDFDSEDDDTVANAIRAIEKSLASYEIVESGEMLHVFALRLMMSHYGLTDKDVPSVTAASIAYIDELLEQGKLPPRELNWRWQDSFSRSFDGRGYYIVDAYRPEFRKIYEHLIQSREKALEKASPVLAKPLLDMLATDSEGFFQQVCVTRHGENPYSLIPILNSIEPNTFVETWLSSHPKNWHWIQSALNERYDGRRLFDELKQEKDWIQRVIELLKLRAQRVTGISRLRIERAIPHKAVNVLASLTSQALSDGA